jgi:hypothetical protein
MEDLRLKANIFSPLISKFDFSIWNYIICSFFTTTLFDDHDLKLSKGDGSNFILETVPLLIVSPKSERTTVYRVTSETITPSFILLLGYFRFELLR